MAFPLPSGLSSPDPLTRRHFVQRLIGGTGITAHTLRHGGALAALVGASTTRLYAATVTPSADIGIDEVSPSGNNNTDTFSVGRVGGSNTNGILFFDDLQGFLAANPGATFNLVLTIVSNGLSLSFDPVLPVLIQEGLSDVSATESTANWNHFASNTELVTAGGTIMMGRVDGEQVSFDITSFVGQAGGNTIRVVLGNTDPSPGIVTFASLQHATVASRPYVESTLAPSASATPAATPSSTPAATPSSTPAATPSSTPAATPSSTPAATPTRTPQASPTPTPTPTFGLTPTPTPTPTLSAPTPSPSLAITPTPSATPMPTPMPSATPRPSPPPQTAQGGNPPRNVRATVSGNGPFTVEVTWDAPSDTTEPVQYQMLFRRIVDTTWTPTFFTSERRLAAAGVPEGTYYFVVRAITQQGSADSSVLMLEVTAAVAPPPAPVLDEPTVAADLVTLTWSDAPGATSYQLLVGSQTGFADLLIQNVGLATTRQVTAPAPRTYYVRVRALNARGVSPDSNERIVETSTPPMQLAAPTDLAIVVEPDGALTVSWNHVAPPADGEVGFIAHVSGSGIDGTTPVQGFTKIGTTHLLHVPAGLLPAGTYTATLAATLGSAQSAPSMPAEFTIGPASTNGPTSTPPPATPEPFPPAPANVTAEISTNPFGTLSVLVTWTSPAGGDASNFEAGIYTSIGDLVTRLTFSTVNAVGTSYSGRLDTSARRQDVSGLYVLELVAIYQGRRSQPSARVPIQQ